MLCEHMDSREVCEKCALIAMRERAEKAEEREVASAKENQAMAEHIERQAEIIDSVALIIGTRGEDPGDIDGFEVLRLHARALLDDCLRAEQRIARFIHGVNAHMAHDGTVGAPLKLVELLRGEIEGTDLTDSIQAEWRKRLEQAHDRIAELESLLSDADQVTRDALGHAHAAKDGEIQKLVEAVGKLAHASGIAWSDVDVPHALEVLAQVTESVRDEDAK